jgi:hypothetical protein
MTIDGMKEQSHYEPVYDDTGKLDIIKTLEHVSLGTPLFEIMPILNALALEINRLRDSSRRSG